MTLLPLSPRSFFIGYANKNRFVGAKSGHLASKRKKLLQNKPRSAIENYSQ